MIKKSTHQVALLSLNFFKQIHVQTWILCLGFFLTALYAYSHTIYVDVEQIIDKAYLFVTTGELVHYGNLAGSGVRGWTPGSFQSLIVGLPMLLWHSPWAALLVLGFLHLLSLWMYKDVIQGQVASTTLTALYVLFWLNPWRMSEVFLWNPGYMFCIAVFHMWSAYKLSKERSFLFSFIHVQTLFLGLQIHLSFLILCFSTLFLFKTKAIKPHLLGAAVGIVFGLSTLIPYFIFLFANPKFLPLAGTHSGKGFLFYGLVTVYPMIKTVWYWILFGSTIFQTHIFHQLDYKWIGNETLAFIVEHFWNIVKWVVGLLGVGFSFRVNFNFYKKYKNDFKIWNQVSSPRRLWMAQYAICMFLGALITVAIGPSGMIFWLLLYMWPAALIPLLLFFDSYLQSPKTGQKATLLLWAFAIYFTIFNFLAAMGSGKHDISSNFHLRYHERYKDPSS